MTDVSYLVTLYNKAKYLPWVVAGLAAQRGDFTREFIFVDDGSTDDTLKVLADLMHQYALPAHVIFQANQGPAGAFNAGLAHCKGVWLKPVDGDDVLRPEATEWLLAAALAQQTDIAFAPMDRQGRYGVDVLPNPPARGGLENLCKQPLPATLKNAQTTPTNWLAKTAIVQGFGGCDAAVFIQDYSLELMLAQHGPWACVDAEIFQAPETAPGRMSDNQAQTLHDVNFALLRFLQRNKNAIKKELVQFALKRAAKRAMAWARRRGKMRNVLNLLPAYSKIMLGTQYNADEMINALCAPFRASHSIRLPKLPD